MVTQNSKYKTIQEVKKIIPSFPASIYRKTDYWEYKPQYQDKNGNPMTRDQYINAFGMDKNPNDIKEKIIKRALDILRGNLTK